MKKLLLARHAESDRSDPSLSDFERPLNRRGHDEARMMAKRLRSLQIRPQIVISSPAKRAATTAEVYVQTIDIPLRFDSRLYDISTQSLIYVITERLSEYESIMLVGHNPSLTEAANLLGNTDIEKIPTAGVVGIRFTDDDTIEGDTFLFEYLKKDSV